MAEAKTGAKAARRIGASFHAPTLAKLDGRTKEAGLVRKLRAALTAHIGGNPSATERALIDRATQLALRIAIMDRDMPAGQPMTEHATRTYLAWSNSYQRTLCELGMKPAARSGAPDLSAYLASAGGAP